VSSEEVTAVFKSDVGNDFKFSVFVLNFTLWSILTNRVFVITQRLKFRY
jgi:hypothetical protein